MAEGGAQNLWKFHEVTASPGGKLLRGFFIVMPGNDLLLDVPLAAEELL